MDMHTNVWSLFVVSMVLSTAAAAILTKEAIANPQTRWEECGRANGPSWVCSPDGVLSEKQGN